MIRLGALLTALALAATPIVGADALSLARAALFRAGRRDLRPGLSYSRALDDPLHRQGYDMIALDVPVSF